jgi:hypothetical protein
VLLSDPAESLSVAMSQADRQAIFLRELLKAKATAIHATEGYVRRKPRES